MSSKHIFYGLEDDAPHPSTAAAGTPLDAMWMQAAADVADLITTDRRVSGRIRLAAALLGQDRRSSLDLIGTHPVSWETVPAALWCAANASTSVEAIFTAVNAGGDTDTIASMAGALVGAAAGTASWPAPLTQMACFKFRPPLPGSTLLLLPQCQTQLNQTSN